MNGNRIILVVDDTTESLKLITDVLSAEGYRVRPADSGELALASIAAIPPDLILLDVRMPGMDGFEVLRRLNAQDGSLAIPVIFLSVTTEWEDRVEGLSLGAVDFIAKPFQREELLARVRTHLELSRLRAELAQKVSDLGLANEQLRIEIAERKLAEAERARLEAENQQLQKAESLGRMAGAIAHNFNNQLGVVLGNLELIQMNLSGDVAIRENLTEAIQATHRSSEISGLMLTYLGQSAGKSEPLDLSELCRQKLSMLKDAIPEGVAFEIDLLPSGPIIRSNADQMRQVLSHLITNGCESIAHNMGTVTLSTRIIQASEIPRSHLAPIGWKPEMEMFACLEVTDTGCGIAEEDLDKIFDPFFTTKFTGRGLGLAVSLGIVKTSGGSIGIETKKDQGSVFRIFLPLVADKLPPTTNKAIIKQVNCRPLDNQALSVFCIYQCSRKKSRPLPAILFSTRLVRRIPRKVKKILQ